jgi:hypothetical protein
MKSRILSGTNIFVALIVLLASLGLNAASAPTHESFAYPADYDLGSQTTNTPSGFKWTRTGTTGRTRVFTVVNDNLSYSGLPPSLGRAVASPTPPSQGLRYHNGGSPSNLGNPLFYSLLLKITALSGLDANGVRLCGFNNASTENQTGDPAVVMGGLWVRLSATPDKFNIGLTSGYDGVQGNATVTWGTADFDVSETILIVVRYEHFTTSSALADMWINPIAESLDSSTPPASDLSNTTTGTSTANKQSFVLFNHTDKFPAYTLDELRIATTWREVTGGDPAILQQPASQTVAAGSTVVFQVAARGTPPVEYAWAREGVGFLTDGGIISGSETDTLTLSGVSMADAGSYYVFVGASGKLLESDRAILTVTDPMIATHPQSRTNDFGTTATFEVTTAGAGPFTFQWSKVGDGPLSDGGKISGSQTSLLTITPVSATDAGGYFVTVSNASTMTTAETQTATLTVRDPLISSQPVSRINFSGQTTTFSVSVAGTGPFTYQWQRNGVPLSDGGSYSGTGTPTLTVSNVSPAEEGLYSVEITGSVANSVISSSATLTVYGISQPPAPRSVLAGNRVVFAIGATPSGAGLTYQWRHAGTNIPGATASLYSIPNAQPGNAGLYQVLVTADTNSLTFDAALTVIPEATLHATNIVVVRVGDGAQTLANSGNSVYLDQFTPAGAYVNTVCIPETGPTALLEAGLDITGGTLFGCALNQSANGKFLVLAGYSVDLGYESSLPSSTSAVVPRGIGVIDSRGDFSLPIKDSTAFSAVHFRGAVFDGTNNYWGCGSANGVYYFGVDGSPASIQTAYPNLRNLSVFNGDLHFVSAASGNLSIRKFSGLPIAPSAHTEVIPGNTQGTDIAVDPAGTTIYLTAANGIQKWEMQSGIWVNVYNLTNGFSGGIRYLAADFSGSEPVVFASTIGDTANRLVRIVDTGATSSATTLASAGVNQLFRGLRFGPLPSAPQPVLSVSLQGNNVVLSWTGSFILQSAPAVTGTYTDIAGATSPHTNSLPGTQRYFRLRQ